MIVVNVLIGVAVLAWVIVNQMRTQPVTTRRLRVAGVLAVVGVLQLRGTVAGHAVPALGWALVLAGLVVGAGLGVWRAHTMRLWVEDGRAMVQGTWFTAGLWVLGIAIHAGLDLVTRAVAPTAEAVGSSSILLFVAVSLGSQALTVAQRARTGEPEAVLADR